MHACIHTHIHTYTYTHRHTRAHTGTHAHIHLHIYIYIYIYGPGSNSPAAGANSQGPQCPSTMGTPWAEDEHMHPGCHETVDSECVEMDVLFKMGHCAGVCTGGEAKRTGAFTVAAAEDAIKRGLQHPYGSMLMCFIGKLVANMGSGFLLEVLMEVPDDAELQLVVFGVGTTGFVALARAAAF